MYVLCWKTCEVLNRSGRDNLGRPRNRWGIILNWILEKWSVSMWAGVVWFRKKTRFGC
jgi:hypothetical protein